MVEPRNLFGGLGNRLFQMAYIYAQMRKEKIPDIYLQDEKYFENVKDEVKQWYSVDVGDPIDMVAIHCRRTDYVNNPFYVDLTETDYYEKAMQEFPDADFLIFSDDIEWCKSYYLFENCEFSENNNEIDDMNLMAGCRGIICANSSFSWWSAYISPYAQKIVAPSIQKWYSDGIERTVCPKNWVRI